MVVYSLILQDLMTCYPLHASSTAKHSKNKQCNFIYSDYNNPVMFVIIIEYCYMKNGRQKKSAIYPSLMTSDDMHVTCTGTVSSP